MEAGQNLKSKGIKGVVPVKKKVTDALQKAREASPINTEKRGREQSSPQLVHTGMKRAADARKVNPETKVKPNYLGQTRKMVGEYANKKEGPKKMEGEIKKRTNYEIIKEEQLTEEAWAQAESYKKMWEHEKQANITLEKMKVELENEIKKHMEEKIKLQSEIHNLGELVCHSRNRPRRFIEVSDDELERIGFVEEEVAIAKMEKEFEEEEIFETREAGIQEEKNPEIEISEDEMEEKELFLSALQVTQTEKLTRAQEANGSAGEKEEEKVSNQKCKMNTLTSTSSHCSTLNLKRKQANLGPIRQCFACKENF